MLWQATLITFVLTTICYIYQDYMTLKLRRMSWRSWSQNLKDATWYIIHIWLLQGTVFSVFITFQYAQLIEIHCRSVFEISTPYLFKCETDNFQGYLRFFPDTLLSELTLT